MTGRLPVAMGGLIYSIRLADSYARRAKLTNAFAEKEATNEENTASRLAGEPED